MVDMVSNQCPADLDAVTDSYLLGKLNKLQRIAFEEHYIGCPQCNDRLQFTEDFVLAVRGAAVHLGISEAATLSGEQTVTQ